MYKVYCGMTYTGSSCENIFKKYPEIYRNNPKEKSGYYRLDNNHWTYCNMTEIAAGAGDFILMCSVMEVGESRMKSTSHNYQTFLPGKSCENIYNASKGSHNASGYYWITSRVYCGMNYTESSCKSIYFKFPETHNKSGYYCIKENNDIQWTYCNMKAITISGDFLSMCAGVGGGWRRIANINISAGDDCPGEWRRATLSGVSFYREASDDKNQGCSAANFSTNGISYQRVCGRARGYQKGDTVAFYGSPAGYNKKLIKVMFLDYQSLTVVILELVSIFGLLLVVVVKDIVVLIIVLVLLIEESVLLLMLTIIIIVNQVQQVLDGLTIMYIISMAHFRMEKGV